MAFNRDNEPVSLTSERAVQELIGEVRLLLGEGMIDIELDPAHYKLAVNVSLDKYRQRSSNSVEESLSFIELQPEIQSFYLPNEIIEVREVFRRGVGGSNTSGGTFLDPFSLAYSNLYLLQAGGQGGLATWDLFSQYQEITGRLFGQFIIFTFDSATKKFTLHRNFQVPETLLLWSYNFRPSSILISDIHAKPWLRSYTVAQCKIMIGEARSLYSGLPGPTGTFNLNGDAVKKEGLEEQARLEKELELNIDADQAYGWITIG